MYRAHSRPICMMRTGDAGTNLRLRMQQVRDLQYGFIIQRCKGTSLLVIESSTAGRSSGTVAFRGPGRRGGLVNSRFAGFKGCERKPALNMKFSRSCIFYIESRGMIVNSQCKNQPHCAILLNELSRPEFRIRPIRVSYFCIRDFKTRWRPSGQREMNKA